MGRCFVDDPAKRAWRTDQEWTRLRARIDAAEQDERLRKPRVWRIAALIAAAVIIAVVLSVRSRAGGGWQTVATKAGDRATLRLSDSSVILLGPATTIRYSVSGARRDVELAGLAEFTVRHDARRPFRVQAGNAIATDLGTRFSVRAYGSDRRVTIAVTEGQVSLASGQSAPIALGAGDVGYASPSSVVWRDSTLRAHELSEWTRGSLRFDDEPLANVASELSRWFGMDVTVADTELARRRVSARYANPTLDGVLRSLGATLDARFAIDGRSVTIRRR